MSQIFWGRITIDRVRVDECDQPEMATMKYINPVRPLYLATVPTKVRLKEIVESLRSGLLTARLFTFSTMLLLSLANGALGGEYVIEKGDDAPVCIAYRGNLNALKPRERALGCA